MWLQTDGQAFSKAEDTLLCGYVTWEVQPTTAKSLLKGAAMSGSPHASHTCPVQDPPFASAYMRRSSVIDEPGNLCDVMTRIFRRGGGAAGETTRECAEPQALRTMQSCRSQHHACWIAAVLALGFIDISAYS